MMYLHYCNNCRQIFLLCGHQQQCLKCGDRIYEIKLAFNDYVDYSPEQRKQVLDSLLDEDTLASMKRTYRFSKRTKRYQAWQLSIKENALD